jgi:hypothetical protein
VASLLRSISPMLLSIAGFLKVFHMGGSGGIVVCSTS